MVTWEPPTTARALRRLHDSRTYFTTDPSAIRTQLQAQAWTPRRMRGSGELWRLGNAETEAACYFSGMIIIHGTPVDLLAVLEEGAQ